MRLQTLPFFPLLFDTGFVEADFTSWVFEDLWYLVFTHPLVEVGGGCRSDICCWAFLGWGVEEEINLPIREPHTRIPLNFWRLPLRGLLRRSPLSNPVYRVKHVGVLWLSTTPPSCPWPTLLPLGTRKLLLLDSLVTRIHGRELLRIVHQHLLLQE